MSFLNLRIRGRLYSGFGILLLFCAGLAGFAVYQLSGIHDQVGRLTVQSKNAIRTGEIAQMHFVHVPGMRRHGAPSRQRRVQFAHDGLLTHEDGG